ncbi:DEAD/DEAH box helicase [Candidatus Woesebacteria bacterium]|nr:DEAD/DEAH box helicase [Candidatus Woesebacteria bacterium]
MSYTQNSRQRGRQSSGRSSNAGRSSGGHYRQSGGNRGRGQQASHINPARYVSSPAIHAAVEEPQFAPINSFEDFGLHNDLVSNVRRRGYTQPTPIQDQAIPVLIEGKDIVGIANTGTGKTAAFLLPFVHKVLSNPDQGVLILAPTRELALQIFDELQAFTKGLPVSHALCIGGTNLSRQIERLKKSPHFVIGTPGRVKDLILRQAFEVSLFTNIVLDEVDRMLDIGFRKDILFLIEQLPENRHAAFFSATMNRETEEIMQRFLRQPVTVSVSKRETALHIEQNVVRIRQGQSKMEVLFELLQQDEFEKVIVFGRTKHGVNRLAQDLHSRGLRVTAIHGNKSQGARQRSLQDFKGGRVQALLATDVAARGIDIDGVTHVINYDEPLTYEDYVHRIGRTGRAGKLGKALTFVM